MTTEVTGDDTQFRPKPYPAFGPSRPPLGLPPGTVRATIAVLIGGVFWALLLFSTRSGEIPLYLYFLLFLELLFIVAHGHTIGGEATGQPSPWWFPRGFFRGLILLGFFATLGWKLYQDPKQLLECLTPSAAQLSNWPYLFLAATAGFSLGRFFRIGPWHRWAWLGDIQAWVSLIAALALATEIMIVTFVNPSLEQKINLTVWEYVLTGIVFYYFALRC